MTTTVIVNGATGKMGQQSVAAIQQASDLELVAQLGRNDDLATTIQTTSAKVVVDFTNAESVYRNTSCIIAAGACPVIGSSGLLPDQVQALQHICQAQQLGGIIAPNFSIGAILMMHCATQVARFMTDVEVIEMHHTGKQDAPSGTALKTTDMLAEILKDKQPLPNRETISGARGAVNHGIHVHAVRLPGLVAHQQVIFGSTGETLTLKHDSINRECFMPGVLLACRKVQQLNTLIYGLEHLLLET